MESKRYRARLFPASRRLPGLPAVLPAFRASGREGVVELRPAYARRPTEPAGTSDCL